MSHEARARRRMAAIGAALLMLAACAPRIDRSGLRDFGGAAASVRSQADESFVRANRVARTAAIDAFVRSGRPGLGEDAFPAAVPPDVVQAWDASLGQIVRYADLLGSLADAGRGAEIGDASAALGKELDDGAVHARLGPSVSSGFALLAGALVQARADRRAHDVLVRTDPAIQALVRAMIEALGTDDRSGLRGTIWSNWTETFGPVRIAYAQAAARRDEDAQRALAGSYLALVDQREAEMEALDHLAASLRALALAHAASAHAQPLSARALLAGIAAQASEARRLFIEAGGAP